MEHEDIKLWFSLSRASWVTIPRVLIGAMPDDWQKQFAKLMNDYEEYFPNQPDVGTRVQITDLNGKLIKTPSEFINYRHPNKQFIESMKERGQYD